MRVAILIGSGCLTLVGITLFLPLGVTIKIMLVCLIALIAIIGIIWSCLRYDKPSIEKAEHLVQVIASTLTAIALVGAAVVYYYDTSQWDQKMSVEIAANAFRLRPAEADPNQVLVEVVLKIANESRQNVNFEQVRVALAFLEDRSFYPDRNGDIQRTDTRTFISPTQKNVNSGESDYGYYELVAPCEANLIQVIAKIPSNQMLRGRKLVYQRKLIVPISDLCAGKVSEVRIPSAATADHS